MSEALNLKTQIEIKLVIQKGPHAGQRFSFSKKEITIGRAPENDIVLLNDPLISREHAKVIVLGQDVEVINLSQKNSIIVSGESVQKWKLVNSGHFTVGDTEFQIQFDLGQSVVPVFPKVNLQVVTTKPAATPTVITAAITAPHQALAIQKKQQLLQQQQMQLQKKMQQQNQQMQFYHQPAAKSLAASSVGLKKLIQNPKIRFYLILAVVAIAGYFYLNSTPDKNKKTEDKKTILKYSDEVAIKLNSQPEKEEQKKIKKLFDLKYSPTALRAQENFMKGMRDFQLGDYSRAQEFFQVVLNLQPGHELAKRHLYLSKVRFDEVVKAKLMLGESNYQKHNFKMCQSLYQQVINMLQGKSSDQNFQLATAMSKKCELAAEGIR